MRAACALAVLLALAADARAQEDDAWARFEIWVQAIESHRPGENDPAMRAMLVLTSPDLESAFPQMVFTLREVAALAQRRARFDETFAPYAADKFKPKDSWRVVAAAQRIAIAGHDAFLKRAAMLHADIGVMWPDAHRSRRFGRGLLVQDGRQAGDEGRPWHWMLGRAFLHLLPDPQSDAFALLWYQAVGNRALSTRNFTEADPHLARALALFAADAEINFLNGWSHDAQASPLIQAALADELLSIPVKERPRYELAVKTARAEQQNAIDAYELAAATDPNHVEARIRLARLLTLHGKPQPAIAHLRAALAGTLDARQRYFAQLFLGRALEASRQIDEARAAFEAARDLMPEAQAPRVALSQLELHAGRRDAALLLLAVDDEASEFEDPWWKYHYVATPAPSTWLDRLRARLKEETK